MLVVVHDRGDMSDTLTPCIASPKGAVELQGTATRVGAWPLQLGLLHESLRFGMKHPVTDSQAREVIALSDLLSKIFANSSVVMEVWVSLYLGPPL